MDKKTDKIKLTPLTELKNIDMPQGFTCDAETGVCNIPVQETTEDNQKEKES